MFHQLRDGVYAGAEAGQGHHLGLIKNQYTARQVVQLAAFGGAVGIERFKELHGSGDNHRHIPVFCGLSHGILLGGGGLAGVKEYPGVVFQHIFFAQNVTEHLGRLFDDGGVWNDVDDTGEVVCSGMGQGKGQGGHGFPASSGDCQRKKSGLFCLPLVLAVLQNGAPEFIEGCFRWKPWGDIRLEFCLQMDKISGVRISRLARHKRFCVQIVCIHQTGVEHPGEEHDGFLVCP